MEQTPNTSLSACKHKSALKNRLFVHLVDDVKQHSNELKELCKDNKDLKRAKKLESLYGRYHEDFIQLVKYLSIQQDISDGSEVEYLEKEAANIRDDCIENITGHSLDFNVDAPCFIPVNIEHSTGDEVEVNCPAQWNHETLSHPWSVLHAHPWPHHFHLPPQHLTSTYPGYHSTMSIPIIAYPYYPGNSPHLPQHNYNIGEEGDTNYGQRRNYGHRRKHKSQRDISHISSRAERRTERINEALPGLHTSKQTGSVTTNVNDDQTTQGQVNTAVTKMDENVCQDSIQVSSSEIVPRIKGTANPERPIPDIPSLMDDDIYLSERLQDFPALSQTAAGKKLREKRLPRAKFSSKLKFSIQDLFKTYGNSDDTNRTNQEKNLSYYYRREKTPKASVFADKKKSPYKNQNNLFTHGQTLCEKGPEEVLDEADGWKKVKPRYHKNKDNLKQISMKENMISAHSCQVCQSTYRRRLDSSKQKKRVNIRRNSHLTSNHYGSPRNNCARDAVATHVLDLHYNNMLVSPHITHRSGKLNNKVNAPVSKNDRVPFVEPKTVSSAPGVIGERELLGTVSKNNNPVYPYSDNDKSIDQLITDNQDLDNGTCDTLAVKSGFLLSPFLDDDFILQNNFPNISTTVSSSSIVDNEEDCKTDSQNNMDLSGDLSIDDDNNINDAIPVVEDAHDMHEEFMKYLNCSTWPTQMDEIDKFESMIAGNNPSDPVLMYPSVSVEQFTEFIQRHPDEAQAFRREITFKLKKIRETESKQQQAYEKRLELLKSKTDKVRGFVQKVKDVQLAQDRLALKRKHQIDEKLRKAEENRKNYLSIIRRKAHDEEEKLKEIAFINELEAQNRRHDSLALRQGHEERLQCIIDERQRRVEEKAAKEAAAEERRRIIEAERQQKLQKIAEARRLKELTIDRKHQERETQRLETAREKAREREERLLARDAAQRATAEELQKRIQQKQEDSARRHQENIESVRQRALEVGLHRNLEETLNISPISKMEEPAEPVQCQDDPEIIKLKSLKKKRLRKIRTRLTSKVSEFLESYPFQESKAYLYSKELEDIKQISDIPDSGELGSKLVALKDALLRNHKIEPTTFVTFMDCKGFLTLCKILKGYVSPTARSVNNTYDINVISIIVEVYKLAFCECGRISFSYIVKSNEIMALIDILRVAVAGLHSNPKWIKVAETLLELITSLLNRRSDCEGQDEVPIRNSLTDICVYAINAGVIDKIINVFQDVVKNETTLQFVSIIPRCVNFFKSMLNLRYKTPDLINSLVSTDCFGTVPLMYEGLQKTGNSDDLPTYVNPIISLMLKFAELDLLKFQDALGSDGMALQIRAISSHLLNYAKLLPMNDLLQSMILLVGYFAMRNIKNQTLLQSGQQPTVLQQLVTLPFIYFCDQAYTDYLFPTLYVCSYNNRTNKAIVENDMSFSQLEDYVNSERGHKNHMMQLFQQMRDR